MAKGVNPLKAMNFENIVHPAQKDFLRALSAPSDRVGFIEEHYRDCPIPPQDIIAALEEVTVRTRNSRAQLETHNLGELRLNSNDIAQYHNLALKRGKVADYVQWFDEKANASLSADSGRQRRGVTAITPRVEDRHVGKTALELFGGVFQWGDWESTVALDYLNKLLPYLLTAAEVEHVAIPLYNEERKRPKKYTHYPAAIMVGGVEYDIVERMRGELNLHLGVVTIPEGADPSTYKDSRTILTVKKVSALVIPQLVKDEAFRGQLLAARSGNPKYIERGTVAAATLLEQSVESRGKSTGAILPVGAHYFMMMVQ